MRRISTSSLTGFDQREIDGLLAIPEEEEANAAPPLPANPVSTPRRSVALRQTSSVVRKCNQRRGCGATIGGPQTEAARHRPAVRH